MQPYDYDMIVIGGGAAGLTAAKTARGFGKRVVIVEERQLGGECTWRGCVPSKAAIKIAQIMHDAQNHAKYGLRLAPGSSVAFDTNKVMDHIRSVTDYVYQTHTPEMLHKDGIEVIFSSCTFVDPHTLSVSGRHIRAKKFVIATGSRPTVPPIPGLADGPYLTNRNLFELDALPASLMVIGGGAIGAEMASALNRLGVTITLIESGEHMLSQEDPELVAHVAAVMQEEGVALVTSTRVTKVTYTATSVTVTTVNAAGIEGSYTAERILIAVGRTANIEHLGLEHAGVGYTNKQIITDATMRTTAPHIYAAGDVAGPYLFSHVAWYQAVTAVRNAYVPFFKKKINYDSIIWVTFTAPEFARMGLTEEQARAQWGNGVEVYRCQYAEIDRGRIDGAHCMVKVVCNKRGKIVGASIVGPRAGELIHELQVTKVFNKRLDELQAVMHAYPSYSELIWKEARKAYLKKLLSNPVIRFITWVTRKS